MFRKVKTPRQPRREFEVWVQVRSEFKERSQRSVIKNYTVLTTYIVVRLTDDPNLQILLFVFLFITYLLSVVGNLTIITLTFVDPCLKTPMYFFLQNFSFLELSFTAVCILRYLYTLATGDNTMTYNPCATQLFFVVVLGVTEFFLLTAMSYDRYVAICKPLHYMTIMNNRVCIKFLIGCYMLALIIVLPHCIMGFDLEICDSNVIDHFGCDAAPILKITCSDTQFIEQFVLVLAGLTLIFTLVCVIMSYTYIIRTILRFPSAQQRKKAFSTCSSHLIVVSITYESCIFIYIKPSAKEGVATNKMVSVLMTSVAPVINPFIYTLRNKQVIQAFKEMIKRVASISKN
ncbi:PREDICTED: olfactory receptor 6C2-like [Propithecus coquereli]|uniref:olfactory receptor 6C2-like n=1 Tax=Propithecus coquereli TaxID=379532 RepID=UPI00063F09B8|nr:PREDICTED: olfactory receptor 6C2-like [Propithecus coquereli]